MTAQSPQNGLRVAVAQMTSTDDIAHNQSQIKELLGQVSQQVDLICFPENSLFFRIGKTMASFDLSEAFFSELEAWSANNNCHILLSFPRKTAEGIFNTTAWLAPGRRAEPVYDKIHLFDVDVKGHPPVRESDHFIHGQSPQMIRIKDWNIGLSICYDLRFSELYQHYAKQGVDLILVPSAFLVATGRAHWHTLLRARAIESQAYVVAAAQGGSHIGKNGDERQTYGHSLVVDPWGKVIVEATEIKPQVIVAELSPALLAQVRQQIPISQHRRLT